MNESSETGPSKAELEELTLLLENRTFVDYFNTFLCLPVFGQHVLYNYMEMEFEFEPPIRNRRHLYLDRREVLKWLCTERLRSFKRSALYTEYNLCMLLRNTSVELPGLQCEKGQDTTVFTRNIIGTVRGMMIFRESMRGTEGETVYRCWKDIETWRLTEDPMKKKYYMREIYIHYISGISATEVASKLKGKVFHGIQDFVPKSDIHQQILDSVADNAFHCFVESDEALLKLQTIQLYALRNYWLPRHLLHILQTVNKETLDILMKPASGDVESIGHERRMRCRYMFPTIYEDSSINSPTTTVLEDLKAPAKTPSLSSLSDTESEDEVEPTDLFALWGGPAKEIKAECPSPASSAFLPEVATSAELSDLKLHAPSAHVRSPIPIALTSYLAGKGRTLLGHFPNTTNRVIWSLASDTLASCPFREFLEQNGKVSDLKYLRFWTDVRNYLDTDEHVTDRHGQSLRLRLAHRIADIYLSKDAEGSDIFSETLKMSLFTAISTNNDISLLCTAQDLVQMNLEEPLKVYVQDERRRFLKQVRGKRCNLNKKQLQAIDQAAKNTRLKSASDAADVDPEYFFNCVTLETASSATSPVFSPTVSYGSAISRPETSYNMSITREQMLKAMELTVLCSQYGVPMTVPESLTNLSQLADVLYSDYGSQHVTRIPTVRNERLRSMLEVEKIDIEKLKVSRKVLWEPIDISIFKKDDDIPRGRGRMIRRAGVIIERPRRPKSLIEVLSNPVQFDFFKRFLMAHKMSLPLMFWRAVEDLHGMSNAMARQSRVVQILRKFFGKGAKYGAALGCDDEIIRQIPHLEKVTPGILMCAQAAVFRSLERKWYILYCNTFPPDSGRSSENSITFTVQTGLVKNFEVAADLVTKTKKVKKRTTGSRRTLALWKNFSKALTTFVKAVSSKTESQLFEMFLKYEAEREKQSPQKDQTGQMPHADKSKSTMMPNAQASVQTRVVVRNKLIIMNRLPADLRFWSEIRKYQSLIDTASLKGSVSDQENEFFMDKAKSIISCFLNSEIMPKVQVNISNDMASNIINSLASDGPKRGSFHDAIISIFPILYHFHKKFSNEWLKGDIPDEYFDSIEAALQDHVSSMPHQGTDMPDFTDLKPDEIKTSTQWTHDDNWMRIHFSISEGVTLIYPQVKKTPTITATGRRMTKHSLHALDEETSQVEVSKGGHGDKAESPQVHKGVDKHQQKKSDGKKHSVGSMKRKKSKKIVVKESEQISSEPPKGRKVSIDKARRLSFLMESLNKVKQEKISEQNKLFSRMMAFEDIIAAAAAMAELPESQSPLSSKESSKD
ncbi:regulator of G-protein signaling protein-like [Mercenaria mercenaria]|uniref:regulator of G-protein signaling protein-like n=1 Tax=Mercenaria mercenaria TaxID=6596 RepID=UPI00234EE571|nr:regulator of G-protein signaling protein-like [Mercenaria mercenaria]